MNPQNFEDSDSEEIQASSKFGQNENQDSELIEDADSNKQSSEDDSDGDSLEDSEQPNHTPSQQERLQFELLRTAIDKQKKRKAFQEQIMHDIVDKLKTYEHAAQTKSGEQLITLRIQELVYNKILVQSYNCSQFRLILAHYHLAKAYLDHECLEQAIEHVTLAIFKNQKLFEDLPMTIEFHCQMLNILGQSLMSKGQYDDAVESLKRSIEIANKIYLESSEDAEKGSNPENLSNRAKILLSKCYLHHKQYQQAIDIINEVIDLAKEKQNRQESYALALVEKANIWAAQGKYNEAVQAEQEAINLLIQVNYSKPELVADLYSQLAGYFQKLLNFQHTLSCLQKVKTLYQQLFPADDKRIIKARRKIATTLLKNERFKEAINELLEIIQVEEKTFGESSIQVARSLKLLGTVYLSMDVGHAKNYLKRSINIFSVHGNTKQANEIRQKLKMIASGKNDMALDIVHEKMISEQDM